MSARRVTGAVAGGVAAGLAISAMLIVGERRSGKPSELANLKRVTTGKLGLETSGENTVPNMREQAIVQGGHLLLSAAAAAVYALATDDEAAVVPTGVGFGLVFYAAMHWVTGPLLGLKSPEWRSGRRTIAMHSANHIGFGIVTAMGAKLAAR